MVCDSWYFDYCFLQHCWHGYFKEDRCPIFHGVAGLIIFVGPFIAKEARKGFFWVGIGGLLIGLGGIALVFISAGSQLLFFSPEFVNAILSPLLMLMSSAFAWGFTHKD